MIVKKVNKFVRLQPLKVLISLFSEQDTVNNSAVIHVLKGYSG